MQCWSRCSLAENLMCPEMEGWHRMLTALLWDFLEPLLLRSTSRIWQKHFGIEFSEMSIFHFFCFFFNRCFLLFMFIASPSRRVYLPSVGAKDTVDHCRANSHRRKWRAFLFPEWVPCSVGRSREGTVMWQANMQVYIYSIHMENMESTRRINMQSHLIINKQPSSTEPGA